MKSQLKALPRRSILFINRKSSPDLYFKAGCTDPEKYHIEVKELVPYVGDKHFNFRVHDGVREYEGAVDVHKLYMVWPEGRERRMRKSRHAGHNNMRRQTYPPLSEAGLEKLRADAGDIPGVAKRRNVTLDAWDLRSESAAAKQHFALGCWLYYYSRRIGLTGPQGLRDRIDCARRIFEAGFANPGYAFFTVFHFGSESSIRSLRWAMAQRLSTGFGSLHESSSISKSRKRLPNSVEASLQWLFKTPRRYSWHSSWSFP